MLLACPPLLPVPLCTETELPQEELPVAQAEMIPLAQISLSVHSRFLSPLHVLFCALLCPDVTHRT